MNEGAENLNVLLIGDSPRSFTHIVNRLEKSGCDCRLVKSYDEARHAMLNEGFDIVLSVVAPRENAIVSLADTLAGTAASFFYALPVEESCWWLPALRRGQPCVGAPALRPNEFAGVLDEVVAEVRASRSAPQNAPAESEKPLKKSSATASSNQSQSRGS